MLLFWKIRYLDSADKGFKDRELWLSVPRGCAPGSLCPGVLCPGVVPRGPGLCPGLCPGVRGCAPGCAPGSVPRVPRGQTDLEFSPLRPRVRSSAMRSRLAFDSLWSRAASRADRLGTLSGRERPRTGTSSARVPRRVPRGQTDLEFSPLRPRVRSSAMRSRLAFDSLWSRAASRADRLGTLSGRERPRTGTSSARVPRRVPRGQTDLEFSPLRPRVRSSAMRSRLAFDSLWSRAASRADRLGTLSGRERPRTGTSSARVASVWCFVR